MHALDGTSGFVGTKYQFELRARFQERQFRLWNGQDSPSLGQIRDDIWALPELYPNTGRYGQ